MLLLSREDIQSLLSFPDYVDAVEDVFRAHAERKSPEPVLAHVDAEEGEFHIKAGILPGPELLFAAKINGGFPQNSLRHNLPSIQGLILLASARNGSPLALMDSGEITLQRTAAATALAAKYLARGDSRVCTLCGTGKQARAQLKAILHFFPLEQVFVWSRTWERALTFASEMEQETGIATAAIQDLSAGLGESSICVTCTSSRRPFIFEDAIPPGMFIAATGADSPTKQELDPHLMAKAKIVTDLTSQAVQVGETHHAIVQGLLRPDDVHAQLGQVIAGLRPGRENNSEIIVFDSTGTALQDVASAAAVYRRASGSGVGTDWKPV